MARRTWSRGFWIVLLLVAPLAFGAARAEEDEGPDEQSAWEEVEAPTVELLDAGSAPLRPLRYTPKAGSSWAAQSSAKGKTTVEMSGMRMPGGDVESVTNFTWQIDSVAPDGTAQVTLTLETIQQSSGIPGAEDGDEAVELMEGRVVRLVVDSRGLVSAIDAEAFDDLPDELAALCNQMETMARGLATPLPEEPVGIGARWRVTEAAPLMGLDGKAETIYTLAERGPHEAVLTREFRIHVEPQLLDELGGQSLPDGMKVKIEKALVVDDDVAITVLLRALGATLKGTLGYEIVGSMVMPGAEGTGMQMKLASTVEMQSSLKELERAGTSR